LYESGETDGHGLRCPGRGQAYVAKRQAAGDTKTEAIRALRRRLSDEVFRRLQAVKPLESTWKAWRASLLETGAIDRVRCLLDRCLGGRGYRPFDALWCGVVTLTTVGYDDVDRSPPTAASRPWR